ncbi:MAG: S-methyl-5'-thioinosine phosphorylase [Gammaproteobacteria bacterium]|nr:S-methyl-5'-thioinosine phosphorylase [Gammaproteobacteria bacterium]
MIGIIGGSGLTRLACLEATHREVVRTPYGEPSAPATMGKVCGHDVVFLPRHGPSHTIPPHEVNYRANIWALHKLGVSQVIAVAAVGSITGLSDCGIMIPDQIIDYTHSREHTFFSGGDKTVTHVDFTEPYCESLRHKLIAGLGILESETRSSGTYGATQGPRFETSAEIRRMERDGVDIVGMTGMPEAVLAREIGLCYATVAVSVNAAAGKGDGIISLKEVERNLEQGMANVRKLLETVIPGLER